MVLILTYVQPTPFIIWTEVIILSAFKNESTVNKAVSDIIVSLRQSRYPQNADLFE